MARDKTSGLPLPCPLIPTEPGPHTLSWATSFLLACLVLLPLSPRRQTAVSRATEAAAGGCCEAQGEPSRRPLGRGVGGARRRGVPPPRADTPSSQPRLGTGPLLQAGWAVRDSCTDVNRQSVSAGPLPFPVYHRLTQCVSCTALTRHNIYSVTILPMILANL